MPQNINCIYNKLNDTAGGKSLNIGNFFPSREKQYSLVLGDRIHHRSHGAERNASL
jgi:hypothetical protein